MSAPSRLQHMAPLGLIMKQEILYFKTAEPRVRFDLDHIQGLVPIISAYAGMTDELIDMLDLEHLDGLIIQAFGAGNIPKETAQKLESLLQKGIPVALVSRCFNGIAEPVYAYQGGGVQLQKAGVFFVKELNAQKSPLETPHRPQCRTNRTGFERLYGRLILFENLCKPRQRRLTVCMVTDFVSFICNLKTVCCAAFNQPPSPLYGIH